MQVTARFGMESLTKSVVAGTTAGMLINDPAVRGALGYGDNIEIRLNGVVIPLDTELTDGAVLLIGTRCGSKA